MAYCDRCEEFIGNFSETPTMSLAIKHLAELHKPKCKGKKKKNA